MRGCGKNNYPGEIFLYLFLICLVFLLFVQRSEVLVCGEEEAMRKSVSLLPCNEGRSSGSTTRVFGVPLEEVSRTLTINGHEVPAIVKYIVDYIEEHGEWSLHYTDTVCAHITILF